MSRARAGLVGRVRVEGVEDLQRKLSRVVGSALAQDELRAAIKRAGEPMRADAAARAPVGTEAVQRKRLHQGIVVRDAEEEEGLWVAISPLREVAHANLQEFGTRHHAAQPFMRPAYDTGKARVLGILRADLQSAIERAVR